MNLSTTTINILKNFSSINPSIAVDPGNVLRTISPQKTILATARVEETFETPFAIYDLGQYLNTFSIFPAPEFEYHENHVFIKSEAGSSTGIQYRYANRAMVTLPPTKALELPDPVVTFTLTEGLFKTIMQVASTLQLPNWSVIGDGEKVEMVVNNVKEKDSNVYRQEVAKTEKEFEIIFKCESLRFIPQEYTCVITDKGISHFSSVNNSLEYFIACEARTR